MAKRQPALPTMARPTIEALDELCEKHQKAKVKKEKATLLFKASAETVQLELVENIKKLEKDADGNHCYLYDDGADGIEYVIPGMGTMRTRKPTKPGSDDPEGEIE
jgi:hypothetical protein